MGRRHRQPADAQPCAHLPGRSDWGRGPAGRRAPQGADRAGAVAQQGAAGRGALGRAVVDKTIRRARLKDMNE